MSPSSPESVGMMPSNSTLVAGLSHSLPVTFEHLPVSDDPFTDSTSPMKEKLDGITVNKCT